MAITPLSTQPNSVTRPATFDTDSDTFHAELPTFITEANALAVAMNAVAAGGAVSLQYTFDSTTADADPGAGKLRLDAATQNTTTTIRADLLGNDTSDYSGVLALLDDSTSTTKGYITLRHSTTPTKWLVFAVTALASPSGYKNVTVTCVASSAASPFTNGDSLLLDFTPTGDMGQTGATGPVFSGTLAQLNAAVSDADVAILGANTFTGTQEMPAVKITTGAAANKYLKSDSVGGATWVDIASSIATVTTATTATTLTSTPTLLSITPTSYGVAVTLPDATTCTLGGPLHIIDNKGAYPVKVMNSAGTLIAFVFGGVVSHISLDAKATAAGIWTVENGELVGAFAQLLTVNMGSIQSCIALDSDREFLLGRGTSDYVYGVVYRKSTNTFGAVAVIRAVACSGRQLAILQATNQVLVVSCDTTTGFEAVICSINAGTDAVTPNTAATATLSANIDAFADGCGLIAVGTSFITSYTVATPAAQIREITVSGTTPTISAATVLDGTAGGLIVAGDATHVIAVSSATTFLYTKPYTIGGLAAGTGTSDSAVSTAVVSKLVPLGTRWACIFYGSGGDPTKGAIISLSGTTTTTSVATLTIHDIADAIVVGSNKVLVISIGPNSNANILTDTAGTASAGTAITLSAAAFRTCLYVSGTDVVVQEGTIDYRIQIVDCSGASPVCKTIAMGNLSNTNLPVFSASNSVLTRSANAIFGTAFARSIVSTEPTQDVAAQVRSQAFNAVMPMKVIYSGNTTYSGKADSERWVTDATTGITKIELATGALA